MTRMLKFAMAAVIALTYGSAWAQVTGATILGTPATPGQYGWLNGVTGTTTAATGTFHAGGVAACDGCHVMHNASGPGVARSTRTSPWTNQVPAFLLQGSDQSSTCLICHGSSTQATAGNQFVITQTGVATGANLNYSPGGDFGWLKATGTGEPAGAGNRHGHNIVATDFGFTPDSMVKAPGGDFTAQASGVAAFACSNCHDPHGRYRMQAVTSTSWNWAGPAGTGLAQITQPIYSSGSYGNLPKTDNGGLATGSYRLLAGKGYVPASAFQSSASFPFPNNPPVAVAPATYNKSEAGSGANRSLEVRVAYGSGMSEWCQNCHTNIHMDNYVSGAMGASGLRHPAGNAAILKPGQFDVYNHYISSGKFNGTTDLYTSLVPFENSAKINYTGNGGDTTSLTNLKNAAGGNDQVGIFVASAQSNVMCLSCHRAHASAFSSMVRWNNDDVFITNASASTFVDSQGRTAGNLLTAGYYGRTPADFGVFQRSLCNKCHGKD